MSFYRHVCCLCIIGLLVILLIAWYPTNILYQTVFPDETQLIVSHSPNREHIIEVVEMDVFPKPPPKIRVKYNDTYIEPSMSTNIRRAYRSENEVKIHQASHARYFQDFLKYVEYGESMPETTKTQVKTMVEEHFQEVYEDDDVELERF